MKYNKYLVPYRPVYQIYFKSEKYIILIYHNFNFTYFIL